MVEAACPYAVDYCCSQTHSNCLLLLPGSRNYGHVGGLDVPEVPYFLVLAAQKSWSQSCTRSIGDHMDRTYFQLLLEAMEVDHNLPEMTRH